MFVHFVQNEKITAKSFTELIRAFVPRRAGTWRAPLQRNGICVSAVVKHPFRCYFAEFPPGQTADNFQRIYLFSSTDTKVARQAVASDASCCERIQVRETNKFKPIWHTPAIDGDHEDPFLRPRSSKLFELRAFPHNVFNIAFVVKPLVTVWRGFVARLT